MARRSTLPEHSALGSRLMCVCRRSKQMLPTRMPFRVIKAQFAVGIFLLGFVLLMLGSVGQVVHEKTVIASAARPASNSSHNGPFPLLLHQIWFEFEDSTASMDKPPPAYQAAGNKVRLNNPNYTRKVWNKDEVIRLIEQDYPWFLDVYNSYPYDIQRTDAARYFIIHKYGGVYLDMDEYTRVPLHDVIKQNNITEYDCAFFSSLPSGISNHFIIARKRSPFIGYLISRLASHNQWYLLPYATVMFSTGPRYVTARFMEYSEKDAILVLSRDQLTSYIAIIGGGSWHHWDGVALNMFYPYLKKGRTYLAFFIVLLVILISTTGVWCVKRSIVWAK